MMTKDEFAKEMKEIYGNGRFDSEEAHGKADSLMYKALKELGYDLSEYDKMCDDFWYS